MITIDTKIREKWHKGFNRSEKPTEIILHGTGGGGTYTYVFNGGRKELYQVGIALFHYLIERDGKTIEIIDPEKWVYHSSSGKHDEETIGIEILNPSANNTQAYTIQQYKSLYDLIVELFQRYPITLIRSHNMTKQIYSGTGKPCPGNFNWHDLEVWLSDSGYEFESEFECFFDIRKSEEIKNQGEEDEKNI